MAATATRVLNVARSQLGYREARGNRTKFGRWYGLDGVSWCDMFISWVGVQSNARDIIGRACYTPAHAQWFKDQGRWGHEPRRGAIAFYDFPDSVHRIQHIGIVEKVLGGGRIQAIEGNTLPPGVYGSQSNGGGVYRRIRAGSLVAGYGYPHYSSEYATTSMDADAARRGKHPPLVVDGQWGRMTTRAMQRWVGVTDDGEIGPQTRKALQRALDLHDDGTWGRVTRKTLQRKLDVNDDGDWGHMTIKAFQHKLNKDWRK
jgi:hypothetical protein